MNGVVDATNKKSKKDHLEIVVTYKDWNEMLPYDALHAYHITVRISMSTTPYSLVFEMEAVMSLEVEIVSLSVLIDAKLEESEWAKLKFE